MFGQSIELLLSRVLLTTVKHTHTLANTKDLGTTSVSFHKENVIFCQICVCASFTSSFQSSTMFSTLWAVLCCLLVVLIVQLVSLSAPQHLISLHCVNSRHLHSNLRETAFPCKTRMVMIVVRHRHTTSQQITLR